ncbi:MAG: ABC transporter substrate-binding protein [Acidobacteriota bacterium]|nr:ABC transporter substrate-binding protein [Acidobacteriota bacterium]
MTVGRRGRSSMRLAVWACVLAVPVTASEDEVTVAFGAEPVQVDPTRTSAGVDEYFLDLFYDQLLRLDRDLVRANWLAKKWEVRERQGTTSIWIEIHEGVKFHNGEELTADDLRYSYTRQSDRTLSRQAGRWNNVADVVVVDDHTLEIVFSKPDSILLPLDFEMYAVPRRYFEEVGEDGIQKHPIGTGPWKFVSRRPRDELVVERFDGYWRPAELPGVERLTIKIIPEDTTRVAAFKTGAVDLIDAVPPAQVEEFRSMPGVKTTSVPSGNNLFLSMNAIDPGSPLRNETVRRAVAHAYDMDAIVEYILFKQGIRTVELAPGSFGYDPTLRAYPYDPEKSRRLLAEAGYPRGINVNCYNLTTPRVPYMKQVGEAIYAYLTEAGVRCRIVQLEYGAWINLGRRDARPEMDGIGHWMWGQGLPGDPTDAWSGHLHSTGDAWGPYSYHADSELDAVVEELRATMDLGEKEALIRRIARVKHDRVAGGLPTYRPLLTMAWRDSLDFLPEPLAGWHSMRGLGRTE